MASFIFTICCDGGEPSSPPPSPVWAKPHGWRCPCRPVCPGHPGSPGSGGISLGRELGPEKETRGDINQIYPWTSSGRLQLAPFYVRNSWFYDKVANLFYFNNKKLHHCKICDFKAKSRKCTKFTMLKVICLWCD